MLHDRTKLALMAALLVALVAIVALGLRNSNQAVPAPTIDIAQVQTKAVLTFANALTSTVKAMPTSTAGPTDTAEPTSPTTTDLTPSVSPTPSCYRMQYVRDVTIPDNTPMTPAEVFTKTWQVQNIGTCAWRPGFKLVLIGGAPMGGSPFEFTASVNPGAKVDISIKMVAPTNQTGIVQGTWRMSDDTGTPFGDALTVVIVVGTGTPVAPTPTATATP